MIIILPILLSLSICAFGIAYFLRNSQIIGNKWYTLILGFGTAVIISVVLLDFLPHQYEAFNELTNTVAEDHHHSGHHHHDHHAHGHGVKINWGSVLQVLLIVITGFLIQIGLEKVFNNKTSVRFNNFTLAFGLFLHSLSETAVLFEHDNNLNQTLFLGILFHKLPVSFILAYTLINKTTLKMSLVWYGLFLLSIPVGLSCNYFMIGSPIVLNIISLFVSGMMLHVVWHLVKDLKEKSKWFYLSFLLGGILGYTLTLFH